MWLLTLIFAMLFGFSAYSTPVEGVARATAVQADAPTPATVVGEPVTALGIEPVSGEMRYVATASELFVPGQASEWQRVGVSPDHEVIVVDSRDELLLWAGTSVDCYRGMETPRPLVQSADGGATWTEAGPEGVVPLASWLNTGIAVAHDCSGLLLSTDSGATWAVPEGYPTGSQVTAFAVESTPEAAGGLLLLVGATGEGGTTDLYRVRVPSGEAPVVEGPLVSWYALGSVEVLTGGAILVGAPQGMIRSDDDGETWSTSRDGLESTTLEQDPMEVFATDLEPGSFGLRTMLAMGEDVFVSGVDGIYRRSEADSSWQMITPVDAEVERMTIAAQGTMLFLQTVDGDVLQVPVE